MPTTDLFTLVACVNFRSTFSFSLRDVDETPGIANVSRISIAILSSALVDFGKGRN